MNLRANSVHCRSDTTPCGIIRGVRSAAAAPDINGISGIAVCHRRALVRRAVSSGLVANVGAIYSAYGSVGLQSGNITVESGIKPAVVSGAVTLRMPGAVDASGDMMYDVSKINLRDTVRGYVAASWTSAIDKTGFLSLSAQVDNQRQVGAAVRFNKMF